MLPRSERQRGSGKEPSFVVAVSLDMVSAIQGV